MKTIDEREMQKSKKKKENKQRQKGARGTEATVKRWELNDFKTKRVIFFEILLNPSFRMTTRFANVARTAASTSIFIY